MHIYIYNNIYIYLIYIQSFDAIGSCWNLPAARHYTERQWFQAQQPEPGNFSQTRDKGQPQKKYTYLGKL